MNRHTPLSTPRTADTSRVAHPARASQGSRHTAAKGAGVATHPVHDRARNKAAEEPPADSAGGFVAFLRTLPVTTGLTVLTALLLLTAATAVAYFAPDPTAVARPAAYAALAVASLVGGMVAGRRMPDRPVLGALGAGVVFALVGALVAIPVGHLVPAPDTLGIADAAPTAGMAVSAAMATFMRLGVALLHPVGAYLTRPRPQKAEHTHPTHRVASRRR